METFYSIPVISNEDEWLQHVASVVESGKHRTQEELLEDALAFDFKFELIPQ